MTPVTLGLTGEQGLHPGVLGAVVRVLGYPGPQVDTSQVPFGNMGQGSNIPWPLPKGIQEGLDLGRGVFFVTLPDPISFCFNLLPLPLLSPRCFPCSLLPSSSSFFFAELIPYQSYSFCLAKTWGKAPVFRFY